MFGANGPLFYLFSPAHIVVLLFFFCSTLLLFYSRKTYFYTEKQKRIFEKVFAITLLFTDIIYHVWLISSDRWSFSSSLPLELCSISLLITIILLWTGDKRLIDFVFFAGIGGAMQALLTPDIDIGFPHFRFYHFFFTHSGIILTALYFVWIKNYRPTFKGIIKTMIVLNLLLPIIFIFNSLTKGNYMFLNKKPQNGSMLDYLGPYPWYLVSLEFVAFIIFTLLWFIFKKRPPFSKGNRPPFSKGNRIEESEKTIN